MYAGRAGQPMKEKKGTSSKAHETSLSFCFHFCFQSSLSLPLPLPCFLSLFPLLLEAGTVLVMHLNQMFGVLQDLPLQENRCQDMDFS